MASESDQKDSPDLTPESGPEDQVKQRAEIQLVVVVTPEKSGEKAELTPCSSPERKASKAKQRDCDAKHRDCDAKHRDCDAKHRDCDAKHRDCDAKHRDCDAKQVSKSRSAKVTDCSRTSGVPKQRKKRTHSMASKQCCPRCDGQSSQKEDEEPPLMNAFTIFLRCLSARLPGRTASEIARRGGQLWWFEMDKSQKMPYIMMAKRFRELRKKQNKASTRKRQQFSE